MKYWPVIVFVAAVVVLLYFIVRHDKDPIKGFLDDEEFEEFDWLLECSLWRSLRATERERFEELYLKRGIKD